MAGTLESFHLARKLVPKHQSTGFSGIPANISAEYEKRNSGAEDKVLLRHEGVCSLESGRKGATR